MNKHFVFMARAKLYCGFVSFKRRMFWSECLKNTPDFDSYSIIAAFKLVLLEAACINIFAIFDWDIIEVAFPIAQSPNDAIMPLLIPTFCPAIMTTAFLQSSGYLPKNSIKIYPPNDPPTIVKSLVLQRTIACLIASQQLDKVRSSLYLPPCAGRSMRMLLYPFLANSLAWGRNIFLEEPAPWRKMIYF